MRMLGKLPARQDPRTLKLRSYVNTAKLPPVPSACVWSDAGSYELYDNDRIGDCAFVTPAHAITAWTFNSADTPDFSPTTDQVVAAYSAVTGYNPADPSTDRGTVMLDMLNYWRHTGIAERPISAYVAIDPDDEQMVRAAIFLFGGICCGFALPAAVANADAWELPARAGRFHRRRRRQWADWTPNSWGGHAVFVPDYNPQRLTCRTWGKRLAIDWPFFLEYCDEAYAAISLDWLGTDDHSPHGFDSAQLQRDLEALNKGP